MRQAGAAHRGLRWFARRAAAHEARALAQLAGVDGVPQLLRWEAGILDRSYMDGAPMQSAQPRDPAYYRAAHRLLKTLRARGLALAVVSNWDISLHKRLDHLGIPVVTSADAGVRKPDPAVFRLAL